MAAPTRHARGIYDVIAVGVVRVEVILILVVVLVVVAVVGLSVSYATRVELAQLVVAVGIDRRTGRQPAARVVARGGGGGGAPASRDISLVHPPRALILQYGGHARAWRGRLALPHGGGRVEQRHRLLPALVLEVTREGGCVARRAFQMTREQPVILEL